VIAVWARVYLGRNWGQPQTLQNDHELVTSGPYHLVRHPIYTGIVLALFGTALAYPFWFIMLFGVGLFSSTAPTWKSVTYVTDFRTRTAPTARARTAWCRLFGSLSPAFGIDTQILVRVAPLRRT
jgi:hypothetical protein